MSGKGYGCRDSVQAPLTLITAFLRLARPSTLGSSVVSRAHVFSAAQIMRADSRRNAQLLLVKLGSFCNTRRGGHLLLAAAALPF